MNEPQNNTSTKPSFSIGEDAFKYNRLRLGLATLFTITFATLALLSPNEYASKALLSPVDEDSSLANVARRFDGIAQLAGFSLGGSEVSEVDIALEVLKSRDFIFEFITKRELLIPLFGGYDWDSVNNIVKIDPDTYDVDNNKWVREVDPPFSPEPSLEEAYKLWMEDIMDVSIDRQTKFIDIKIKYISPYESQKWLTWIIQDVNNLLRKRDVDVADRAIGYLQTEVVNTESLELREVYYSLIEEQTKTKMLAFSNKYYALDVIDSPSFSLKKVGPFRLLLSILGLIVGYFAGLFASLVIQYYKYYKSLAT